MDSDQRDKGKSEWIIGAALIVVGLGLLASNLFSFSPVSNWWAFFILIPAVVNLNQAWRSYKNQGRLTEKARGKLVGGLLIGAVGFILLFGFSFGSWWPIFLIIVGLGALLKARG
jgi:hypothetical protein